MSERVRPSRSAFGGVLLFVMVVSLVGPASAHAILGVDISNPLGVEVPNPLEVGKDIVGGVVGVPGEIAGKAGAALVKEVIEFLVGGIQSVITLEVIQYLTTIHLEIGPSLEKVTGPVIVIGGFFLLVGLITSIGDGYREIIAGTDTGPRVIGQALFRILGLALLLGSWYYLVPLAVDVANGMSAYILDDAAVRRAVAKSFRTGTVGSLVGGGAAPLLMLMVAVSLIAAMLGLLVIKYVVVIAFAMLYVGGPALIGFAALPRVGPIPLAIATRGLLTLMVIPLTWAVVFVAWAGVTAGLLETAPDRAGSAIFKLGGAGLYLAGVVIIFGVTKKLLSLATLGIPASAPGGRIARSIVAMKVAGAIGKAAQAGVAGGAARSGSPGTRGGVTAGAPSEHSSNGPSTRGKPVRGESQAPRERRRLDTQTHRAAEGSVSRKASETHGLFTTEEGQFQPVSVAHQRWSSVEREIGLRRDRGVSDVDAQGAADTLETNDRSALYGSMWHARQDHTDQPERQQRAHGRGVAKQIEAEGLSGSYRDAAITLGAASPDQLERVAGADFRAFGKSYGGYDPTLFPPDAPTVATPGSGDRREAPDREQRS